MSITFGLVIRQYIRLCVLYTLLMASQQTPAETMIDARSDVSDGPLMTVTRNIQEFQNGSKFVSFPSEAADIQDVSKGDEVAIRIYRDRIEVHIEV